MLPSDESRIIEQAKFNYSPLGKSLENQTKTIKDQGEKQNQLKITMIVKQITYHI